MKQSVAHKSGRQFSGMGVKGFRTSSQDDAEYGNILDGREISKFGKEFLQIELCGSTNNCGYIRSQLFDITIKCRQQHRHIDYG